LAVADFPPFGASFPAKLQPLDLILRVEIGICPAIFFFRYLAKFYGCGHVFAGEPQGMFTATRITNPFEIFGVLGFS
jgi:hypothetical protein